MLGKVVAVSAGPESTLDLGNRTIETGIRKSAKPSILVGFEGVEGDFIGDDAHHGGPDQALYVYFVEDHGFWGDELGPEAAVGPGRFGENVLLQGFAEHEVRIGDRFQGRDCSFEVTAPRIPCSTLSSVMGQPTLVKRFIEVERPGFYARVLRPGQLSTGEEVTLEPAPLQHITLLELYREWYARPHDAVRLRLGLASPIAERTREKFLEWLRDTAPLPRT